jgi:hypothetical protein
MTSGSLPNVSRKNCRVSDAFMAGMVRSRIALRGYF